MKRAVRKIKSDEKLDDKIYFSSGCDRLDIALSNPFPCGKIVNIVGDKSTAKTLLISECIYRAKERFGNKLKWSYDDTEDGYSFDSQEIYGIDIIDEKRESSETIEKFGYNLNKFCDSLKLDEYGIYVVDSLDGLPAEMELVRARKQRKAIEDGKSLENETGSFNQEKQRFLSGFFKEISKTIRDKNVLLIIISQVRHNIGVMFGEKYTRSGGKALDHYCSQIIWLAEADKHKIIEKGCEVITGITIKAHVKKNKSGKPFRKCFIDILFDYGIDNIPTNLRFLLNLYTDSGKWVKNKIVKFNDVEFKNINVAVSYIEENNLQVELVKQTKAKWKAIEDAVQPERKAKY